MDRKIQAHKPDLFHSWCHVPVPNIPVLALPNAAANHQQSLDRKMMDRKIKAHKPDLFHSWCHDCRARKAS